MAALLSGDITGRNFKKKDSLVEHVEDCRRMGIDVAPPDVNESVGDFSVQGGRIVFGLAAVKGCGEQAAAAIAAERAARGSFRDLHDFCGRLDPSVVNKTAIENLTKAGALDALGGHRGALLAGVEKAMAAGAAQLADRKSGQKNLFAAFDEPQAAAAVVPSGLPDVPPLSDLEMRSNEKEVLGYYIHSHPLAEFQGLIEAICTHGTGDLGTAKAKETVVIGGLVAALKLSNTKQARPGSTHTRYGMFDLEDMDGLVRSICWPEDYARLGDHLQPDAVVLVAGSIDRRAGSEETNLIVNEILPLADAARLPAKSVTVRLVEGEHDRGTLDRLAGVLKRHPGKVPVRLVLDLAEGTRVLLEADGAAVEWSPALQGALADLLGTGGVRATVGLGGRRPAGEPGRRGPQGRAAAGVG
jgi:DNA polymerase-3 subunit alpha